MGTLSGFAEEVLELSEDLFDGVQVRAVGRQEQQPCTGAADGCAHGGFLVARQVVHDDDVAGRERGHQALLYIIGEALAVDRLIQHAGSVNPVAAKGCEEGHRAPMPIRHFGMEALPAWCPTAQWGHVCLGPSLVDKDETGRIKPPLILFPLRPPSGDPRPELFGGQHAFF